MHVRMYLCVRHSNRFGVFFRSRMAHPVQEHQSRLPVAQAAVLALPASSQTQVSLQTGDPIMMPVLFMAAGTF